ncbi:MAG TPA: TIM barrel protein [Streptosporangiaceae bacterium]|jgi:4-hydroxyphenylpyruvate dioxygenase
MRTSIATVSISGTLAEKLAAIAAAGFDGVEIFDADLTASPLSPEDVRLRAADLGLRIEMYQPMRDFESVPAARLQENLRGAEHRFQIMDRLGTDLLLVCSNVSDAAIGGDALAAEQLATLADRAAAHGLRLAYEALAWGRHVHDYLHSWRIVEMADRPNLGVCLDSFHILSRGADPVGIGAIPGEKIFFLQLADAPRLAMNVLQWSRHYRCFPGQGSFDLPDLVSRVLRAGYAGPLSIEVFNDAFRAADTGRIAVDAMRSLITLQERVAGTPGGVAPTAFAFAEFTGADLTGQAGLLSALGFVRTGTHDRKPVELWEQGGARILLNGAGAGPTALGAVGLESPDPSASVRRAESLLSPVLPRERDPRDAPLHAVAAPDGTQIFFCTTDRATGWLADFRPSAPVAGAVTGIDHVALTQPRHYFDEAALFYQSVLGLRGDESQEYPDPYGLLRSRAMSGDGVRIAINVADTGTPGVLWQHVALAADDVMAVARRLRDLDDGLVLPIPGNYYDDLAARWDVPAGLRELNVLYDRDEHGAFLHLYTRTMGRVFLEVVQRVGGYAGYGARNVPIRLAAQHVRAGGAASVVA